MRVLHLAPPAASANGVGAYAAAFRDQVRECRAGIEHLDVPSCASNAVRDLRGYAVAARSLVQRGGFDIVHAEVGAGSLREFYAVLAVQRRTPLPVCLTAHDPPRLVWYPFHVAAIREFRYVRGGVSVAARPAAERLESHAASRSAALFTLSRLGRDRLQDRFGTAIPVHVLPYPARRAEQRPTRPRRDHLSVAFYGHWYGSKGLETLVDALAIARGRGVAVRATFYGEPTASAGSRPSERYREHVLRKIAANGLEAAVDLPGWLPDAEVVTALQECDLVVLPYQMGRSVRSLASTSAVLHEALAAGVPVLATDVRALSEHVVHGDNGLLVPERDPEALAGALEQVWREPRLLDRLRVGAGRTAEHYAEPAGGRRAVEIYEEVLANRARRATTARRTPGSSTRAAISRPR